MLTTGGMHEPSPDLRDRWAADRPRTRLPSIRPKRARRAYFLWCEDRAVSGLTPPRYRRSEFGAADSARRDRRHKTYGTHVGYRAPTVPDGETPRRRED